MESAAPEVNVWNKISGQKEYGEANGDVEFQGNVG